MRVDYVNDINIPEDWPREGAGDWLHPENGRLPDHISLLRCGEYHFLSAVWELHRSLVVMTERLDQDDPDPAAPLRNIDEVYTTGGWIAQTHCWNISPSGIRNDKKVINPEKFKNHLDWRRGIYRAVITETLKMVCDESYTV